MARCVPTAPPDPPAPADLPAPSDAAAPAPPPPPVAPAAPAAPARPPSPPAGPPPPPRSPAIRPGRPAGHLRVAGLPPGRLAGEHVDRHVAHVTLVRQVQHVAVAERDHGLGRHPQQPALAPLHQPDRETDQVPVP